jgi:hypothetical protein
MKFNTIIKTVTASVFGAAMLLTGGVAQADYPCKERHSSFLILQVVVLTKWQDV